MAPSESAAQTPTQVLPRGPGVLRFAVAGFCNALSTGFFYPFSLLFYVSLSGEELRTVGTVLTVTALAALPSLLLVGRIVDRVGPRPVLIASLVVRAGCFVSFVTFGGAAALAVGTLALAVSTRAEQTATPLVALQLAPEGQSSRWLALSRVVFNAGMGVGALIAGIFIVDSASGFALLGIANAVGILCTAALYAVVPRTPRPAHSAARVRIKARPWRDHKFLLIAVVNALLLVSALAVESGMPVYVLQELAMPTWTVGMLFAVNTGVLTALQLPVSRVLDRPPPGPRPRLRRPHLPLPVRRPPRRRADRRHRADAPARAGHGGVHPRANWPSPRPPWSCSPVCPRTPARAPTSASTRSSWAPPRRWPPCW